ncbi:olfactory receptor 1019 [Xenopus laevis]|uniref:Olfactory receptor n=2 Tax=Xenopus laevis TaxID=8355 RepID=A0A974CGA0_XENLA|nr:olfactory receptor 1019 [Xenopus laevis]OCT72727.1 hypothetical protein XELAEV_18035710mg [Xenopus laevis]
MYGVPVNHSTVREFILVGLWENPELQFLLFVVFLCIYIITMIGNLSIIVAYKFSPNLQTPMYFFLANFSFLEICYISTTVPKMLSGFTAEHKTISVEGCLIQMFFFLLLGGTECYLLASMAYDRYIAICHPLLYFNIMNKGVCIQLIVGSWLIGTINSLIHTYLTFTLPFCGGIRIDHFYCDISPLLNLACSDTWVNETVLRVMCGCVILGTFLLTLTSYILIIVTILKIHSISGRNKVFSTCSSHFMVVMIFYGSATFMYFRPKLNYGTGQDRFISIMYAVIAPLLNPFIYSLRNQQVKDAVRKLIYIIIGTHRCNTFL